jgi:hypothetical protein
MVMVYAAASLFDMRHVAQTMFAYMIRLKMRNGEKKWLGEPVPR